MAKHLDLEEQEQLDQIKHFWSRYGNAITWVLIVVLGGFAAWNGWNYWQRTQAAKAAALYDEIERAVLARDAARVDRAVADIQTQYGSTTFAAQGVFLAARTLFDQGKADGAKAALTWVAEQGKDPSYQALARLRLAAMAIDGKALDEAQKWLEAPVPASFEALRADRRGDLHLARGQKEEALKSYQAAWQAFGARTEYRQLVAVKLASLGVDVEASANGKEVAQ